MDRKKMYKRCRAAEKKSSSAKREKGTRTVFGLREGGGGGKKMKA